MTHTLSGSPDKMATSLKNGQITLTVIMVLNVLSELFSVHGFCPEYAAQRAAQICISGLGINPLMPSGPAESFFSTGTMHKATEACESGQFEEAIQCISDMRQDCIGSPEEENIRKFFNVEGMKTSVQYLCAHLQDYEDNKECISEQSAALTECSKEEFEKLKETISNNAQQSSNSTDAACRFMNAAFTCVTDINKDKCGDSTADFVYNVLDGFRMPYCKQLTSACRANIGSPFFWILLGAMYQCLA